MNFGPPPSTGSMTSRLFGRSKSPVNTKCRPSGEKQGHAPSGQIRLNEANRFLIISVTPVCRGIVKIETEDFKAQRTLVPNPTGEQYGFLQTIPIETLSIDNHVCYSTRPVVPKIGQALRIGGPGFKYNHGDCQLELG